MPIEVRSLAEWEADFVPKMLSVVIPARNEAHQIETTVRGIYAALTHAGIPHEILVIDDGSTDGTDAALERLAVDVPTVRHMYNAPPGGYGFAVRLGLSTFRGEAVAIVMADQSDSPQDLVTYYRAWDVGGYDCVFGSRFIAGARTVAYPWPKLVLNRIGNFLIRVLFWMRYNDTTNAFKLYRRSVIAGLQPLLASHFNLTVEMPLKAIVRGYSYAVVPISWVNRSAGVSKFKVKEIGSRYIFIVLYCYLEKSLLGAEYRDRKNVGDRQLQVWSR